MVFLLPFAVALLMLALYQTYRYRLLRDKVRELKDKVKLVIESEEALQKVSFDQEHELYDLVESFNAISQRNQMLKDKAAELASMRFEDQEMGQELEKFKSALSQIDMLTGIGKQITSSLDIMDILRVSFGNIRASMDLYEMQVRFQKEGQTEYVVIRDLDKVLYKGEDENQVAGELLHWVMVNNKEVELADAQRDFSQYVFHPPAFNGQKPIKSLLAFPLSLKGTAIGSLIVGADRKDAFQLHHADFIRSLTSYMAVAIDNCNVYQLLEEGKQLIEQEQEKSERLLLNILPADIAEELKQHGSAQARGFESVHVLFTDFSGFTEYASRLSAEELVDELNICFSAFDSICQEYGIEKIKTIGDAYMAAGGLAGDPESAVKTIEAALAMRDFITRRVKTKVNEKELKLGIRVGVHSGPLVAGIVGLQKFQYDLWGDTVNTASRMESNGEVGKVNISRNTFELLKDHRAFAFENRGKRVVKGKGEMEMFFVESLAESPQVGAA